MSPASVNTISRASQAAAAATATPSQIDTNPNTFSIRDFVVDEDAANFNSALWKTIDQSAFVLAQREALEAFNVAKALRLSEETAALENQRRAVVAGTSSSASASATPAAAVSDLQVVPIHQNSSSSSTQSQALAIAKDATAHFASSDEAAARSLARTWQVDALQPALLENKPGPSSSSSFSSSSASASAAKPKTLTSHHHDKKASGSAAIAKHSSTQPHLSLSPSSSSSASAINNIASDSVPVHSRASAHFNSIPSSSHSHSESHRIEHRSLSKREPDSSVSISMSPSSSSSSSRPQISDGTNTTAKRRRTERPPSTAASSPNTLVAPPISQPKKSTASARDVRLGLIMNPATKQDSSSSSTPPTPTEPRPRRRSGATRQTSETRDIFTATRNCAKCGNLVLSPRSQSTSFELDPFSLPFSDLLHVTCTGCRTTHCRGCFAVAQCPRQCSGGPTCTVRNCCPEVRAIAIFEALSSFDNAYAAEAGFATTVVGKGAGGSMQQREAYVKRLISKTDKSMRRFEDAFVRTLRVLCSWLQMASESESEDSSEGTGASRGRGGLHPSVTRLFSISFLPEVMHAFLRNNNVRDWVAHSETYLAILDTLRRMLDAGLAPLLSAPLPRIDASCGLRGVVWDGGSITFERDASDADAKGGAVEVGPRAGAAAPLGDLVRQLEGHRRPLMALAGKVQFAATVEKVNNLCDGISYLLLQQVVGGI